MFLLATVVLALTTLLGSNQYNLLIIESLVAVISHARIIRPVSSTVICRFALTVPKAILQTPMVVTETSILASTSESCRPVAVRLLSTLLQLLVHALRRQPLRQALFQTMEASLQDSQFRTPHHIRVGFRQRVCWSCCCNIRYIRFVSRGA